MWRERTAFRAVESEWLAIKSHVAAERYLLSLRHVARVLRKDFDPDQPRDEQGRWTDAGGADALDGADVVLTGGPGAEPGYKINILDEDALGGHTFERHVGKPEEYLKARLLESRINIPGVGFGGELRAGSFTSLEAANKLVNVTIA